METFGFVSAWTLAILALLFGSGLFTLGYDGESCPFVVIGLAVVVAALAAMVWLAGYAT